jgi:hypothetical protein
MTAILVLTRTPAVLATAGPGFGLPARATARAIPA